MFQLSKFLVALRFIYILTEQKIEEKVINYFNLVLLIKHHHQHNYNIYLKLIT